MAEKQKKKPVVWVIDDEIYNRSALRVELEKDAHVRTFESPFHAVESSAPSPAVIVIDLSSVAPIAAGSHMAYSGILNLADRYPGAVILIASAVGAGYAQDTADLVRENSDSVVEIVAWTMEFYSDIASHVRKHL